MAQPSRASTTRAHVARPSANRGSRGKFHIDPKLIPRDKHYVWVRETVLGQRDGENVNERMLNGFLPVEASRHPELLPPDFPGEAKATLIRRGGMLLMECPLDQHLAEMEDYRLENEEILQAVDADRQASADAKNFPATKPELSHKIERSAGKDGRFDEG